MERGRECKITNRGACGGTRGAEQPSCGGRHGAENGRRRCDSIKAHLLRSICPQWTRRRTPLRVAWKHANHRARRANEPHAAPVPVAAWNRSRASCTAKTGNRLNPNSSGDTHALRSWPWANIRSLHLSKHIQIFPAWVARIHLIRGAPPAPSW